MAEASRSYEMGSPTRENDRSVLLQEEQPVQDPPPVKSLLLAFLIMFQGYGVMNGNPQHALKMKLDLAPDQAGAFQDATASFQLSKLLMRVLQISLLVFMQPNFGRFDGKAVRSGTQMLVKPEPPPCQLHAR